MLGYEAATCLLVLVFCGKSMAKDMHDCTYAWLYLMCYLCPYLWPNRLTKHYNYKICIRMQQNLYQDAIIYTVLRMHASTFAWTIHSMNPVIVVITILAREISLKLWCCTVLLQKTAVVKDFSHCWWKRSFSTDVDAGILIGLWLCMSL